MEHSTTFRTKERSPFTFRAFSVCLAAVGLLATVTCAQSITFRFNPPNGMTFVQTVTTNATKESSRLPKATQMFSTKTRVKIQHIPSGFLMSFTPVSTTITENGKAIPTPKDPTKNMPFSYELNKQGHFVTVRGLDQIIKTMAKTLTPEQAKHFSATQYRQGLIEQQKADWEDKIGEFLGKTVKIGDVWTNNDPVPLPTGGMTTARTEQKFAGMVSKGGHNCVRITMTESADPEKLKEAMNAEWADQARHDAGKGGKKPKPAKVLSLSMTYFGERILDPSTMMEYSASLTQITKATMDVPGQGHVTVTTTEKTVSVNEYK